MTEVASQARLEVSDKFTGEVLGTVPASSPADVARVAREAAEAFRTDPLPSWRRFQVLEAVADLVRRDAGEIAVTLAREVGKTIKEAKAEVAAGEQALVFAGEEAKRIGGEVLNLDAIKSLGHRFGFAIRVPSGPVCAIAPFNAPFNQAAQKIGSAIAAGCPVVIKPAPATPLTTVHLARLFAEAGLPTGHLHVLHGGAEVGEALLHESAFTRYLFTGSQTVGEHIHATVGLRPTLLELGSNAATIVHSDANLAKAAEACAASGFAIAGQVCTSVQRILVQREVLEDFTKELVRVVAGKRLGNPLDESTDIGPMISDAAAERVEMWLKEAVDGGAKVVIGGHRDGRLFEPTVLRDVQASMKVVCQELFGPIVSVLPYDSFGEALEMANDSPFGLQGGVFTQSIDIAFQAASGFHVGGLLINDASRFRAPHQPYGGVKASGMGREGPRYAIEELTDLKTVIFSL